VFKAIIWDFGGVFTRVQPRDQLLKRCEVELGLRLGTLTQLLFTGEHWLAVSTGQASTEEYWQYVRTALGGHVPVELEPFQCNPFAYERLNRSTVALARHLHKLYRSALLSNATPYLDTLLAEQRLEDLFDVVVNSSRVGLRKPDVAIYQMTVECLQLLPQQCLFVDDKLRNTNAAKALGMQTMTFQSTAHLSRQLHALGCLGHG